ncbi:winged helix DNA-binding domain-containing protein [Streptosporangium amethystogenes]|uniref:winged helix DNA-binding domain-containing protein n=1 Tax=Streptosporangium amethystogenes TaxID=2002 RepID=UPI00378CE635
MTLTARRLNRATLSRQMLLRREVTAAADAVRRLPALQAQEAASPYIALWNRLTDFDPKELDAAFSSRALVKASLMRITLHAVHAEDYPDFHHAMLPGLRASRLGDTRFTASGLSVVEAEALLPSLAKFAIRPRTRAEIEDFLAAELGGPRQGVWWALRTFAALHHAPSGGPWSFAARPSFVTAGTAPGPTSQDESVQRLALRYLRAFGPASAADFAQFTMLRRTVALQALRALTGEVEELKGPDGVTLFDVPGAPIPAEDTVAPPRLLPMWDSVLLAYADRSRVIPPEYRPLVIRRNGDVLPTLLVDGYVAGVWRPVEGGIEASAFHLLDDKTWQGLASEAGALTAFLADRDPAVYRRYAHWWAKSMPSAETRLLPG